jgi:hypothetical protein
MWVFFTLHNLKMKSIKFFGRDLMPTKSQIGASLFAVNLFTRTVLSQEI